jgi:iron-regulated transporter 1
VIACSAFLGLFIAVKPVNYKHAPTSAWIAFLSVVLAGCALSLANNGHSIAVERDWVTTIAAKHSEDTLTRLNAYMRRIDLLCKLLAPLFMSLLTTTTSYTFAVAFQLGFAVLTLVFELLWVQVVFRKFPMLLVKDEAGPEACEAGVSIDDNAASRVNTAKQTFLGRCLSALRDWQEFARMPVFSTAVAISFLYLTVLSFDGTLIAYLKERDFKDAFIAGQRGICVVTGLLGTIIMPWLEKRIGLVRTGAWAILYACHFRQRATS